MKQNIILGIKQRDSSCYFNSYCVYRSGYTPGVPGRESCTRFGASEDDRLYSSTVGVYKQIGIGDPDMEILELTNMAEICESFRCLCRVRMTQKPYDLLSKHKDLH
jgi:hypothetical protein